MQMQISIIFCLSSSNNQPQFEICSLYPCSKGKGFFAVSAGDIRIQCMSICYHVFIGNDKTTSTEYKAIWQKQNTIWSVK